MKIWKRSRPGAAASLLIAALLLSGPSFAQDNAPTSRWADYGAKSFDAVVLRPLGLSAVLVGSALFVPVAVITSPGGKDTVEEALELFVLEPGAFVFKRPLGSF